MVAFALPALLLGSRLAFALPIYPRQVTLNPEAVAEAQKRDATATRAFSAVPIKAADGSCLFVDPLSGDFRQNLIPIQTAPCDGSAAQQWDVITAGVHNDQPGNALVVSALTQGCLNFDPRRAPGNQVILFSCGGRADGGGVVTDSQLFPFAGGAGPLALAPNSGRGAVCLTVTGGRVDQTACTPATASGNELFTFGAASDTTPAPTPIPSSSPAPAPVPSPAPVPPSNPNVKTGVTLNPEAVAEAQRRDATATRALSGVPIKTADGLCLFVDPTSGDFRENLIPIQTATCDDSDAQKWDVITAGVHNNQPGNALIVSALTQGCLNFDDRRAAGNQVLLFSCGGRADGDGQVTDSQLFPFTGAAGPLALAPKSGRNAVCLTIKDGLVDQTPCNPAAATGNELFTFGDAIGAAPAPPPTTPSPAPVPAPVPAPETPTAPAPPAGSAPVTPSNPNVKTGVTLDQAATAEAQRRDATATRALSGVPIKTADGLCLFVDPTSGDFRQNLIPVQTATCDGSAAQQWDVITAGVHNNQPGNALIVSALTQGCLNFDDRRAAGNQVLLFSCGGRADGDGQVTDSQLFPFTSGTTGPIALAPKSGRNAVCLTIKDGLVDQTACNPAAASGNELFTIQ